jgi:pyruvate dehydrogenase E1 component alpha subunit
VPLAAGAAFASKYRNDGRVTVCYFGDGAATIGGFAEGLSLSALWKLPIVLICENNQYSMGTPLYRSLAVEDVSMRALAHGMARDRFDGDDVIRRQAPHRRGGRARPHHRRADAGRDRTYRFRGHSMSDPGLYRTKDEVEEWRRRDPLNRSRSQLAELGMGEAALEALEADVKAEIEDSVRSPRRARRPTPTPVRHEGSPVRWR